jgi:pimeloyl-ACP methyl ester carboxylesterase
MVVIEDAAHMHLDEKPEEYLRVVTGFLQEVEKR